MNATLAEAAPGAGRWARISTSKPPSPRDRVLAPIDHPDAAHLQMTGTGLTHLGSAEGRDKMHEGRARPERGAGEQLTDSMRMFLMGVEERQAGSGQEGVQPEWFYKGDGSQLVGPGQALTSPSFAQGRRRGARDRRDLPDRPRWDSPSPGLLPGQRILGPCDRTRQLSVASPFQAAPGGPGSRSC
ncbi:hypothetical protein ACRAWD_15060 [Caulobacter segnis]